MRHIANNVIFDKNFLLNNEMKKKKKNIEKQKRKRSWKRIHENLISYKTSIWWHTNKFLLYTFWYNISMMIFSLFLRFRVFFLLLCWLALFQIINRLVAVVVDTQTIQWNYFRLKVTWFVMRQLAVMWNRFTFRSHLNVSFLNIFP